MRQVVWYDVDVLEVSNISWTIKPGMNFEVFGRVVKAWQGEDF